MRVRYGSWSGSQDPFPAEVDADAVMDEIGEDLLDGLHERMVSADGAGAVSAGVEPGVAWQAARSSVRAAVVRIGLLGSVIDPAS